MKSVDTASSPGVWLASRARGRVASGRMHVVSGGALHVRLLAVLHSRFLSSSREDWGGDGRHAQRKSPGRKRGGNLFNGEAR